MRGRLLLQKLRLIHESWTIPPFLWNARLMIRTITLHFSFSNVIKCYIYIRPYLETNLDKWQHLHINISLYYITKLWLQFLIVIPYQKFQVRKINLKPNVQWFPVVKRTMLVSAITFKCVLQLIHQISWKILLLLPRIRSVPGYNVFPVSNSAIIQPTDHISTEKKIGNETNTF